MLAGLYLFMFILYWGYFSLFEIFWKGQTPGKRQAGIRVIHESGREINSYEAISRNLLRAVDSIPGIYAVAVVVMFMNDQNKRLGDYVAGTVVVHEKKQEESVPYWYLQSGDSKVEFDVSAITPMEIEIIEVFLQRRFDYEYSVRAQSANKLAVHIRKKMALQSESGGNDEAFLESIVREFRRVARFR